MCADGYVSLCLMHKETPMVRFHFYNPSTFYTFLPLTDACVILTKTAQTARKETTRQGVHVVYTGTETADSYIERAVFEQCEAGRRQVWAATSDAAQFKFSSAKGAHVMSSNLFIQELKKTKQEIKERLATLDESAARGKMLIANVDEQTKAKLYELRDKLDGRGWPPTEKG